MARTNNLSNFLTDVADAIRTAEGSSETIQASDFDTRIEALSGGGGADLSEYISGTLTGKSSDYTPFPWQMVIHKLPALSNSGNTCQNMFRGFMGTSIDLSNFDTTNVQTMKDMFRGCENITELNLSSFFTPNLTVVQNMFTYCSNLLKIDMRNMDFTNVTVWTQWLVGVSTNCLIIVKDTTQKTLVTANASDYTNIKTVAEYEAEQNA